MVLQTVMARAFSRFYFNKFLNIHKYELNCNIIMRRNLGTGGETPIEMAYNTFEGNNPVTDTVPVIVMHGLFGSKMNWQSLGKAIAQKTQKTVYVVDARNHGDSPHTDEHTYFHLLEDITHFMSNKNINKAALIGHSMGGRAVMAVALQHPQKVESLTVVDISPINMPDDMNHMDTVFNAMESIKPVTSNNLSSARKEVEIQLRRSLGSKDLSNFLAMNVGEKEPGKFTWKINLKSLIKNYVPHIMAFPIKGQFNGPVLFICGAQSDFVDLNKTDKIKEIFPKASFVSIEDAGHWVHAEQPKKVLDATSNFINDNKS